VKNFCLSLTTRSELADKINELLSGDPKQKYYVNITKTKKKRSLSANAQQSVWYKQISEHTSTDIKTVTADCKIDFGLPIVLSDYEVGRPIGYMLERSGFFSMTREKQIRLIGVIQITSLMNTKQHNQYRENILYYWNQHGLNIGYET